MNAYEKIQKRIQRAKVRYQKNIERNIPKLERKWKYGTGMDCPYDVDMNGSYGTCNCGGVNYNSCLGDI